MLNPELATNNRLVDRLARSGPLSKLGEQVQKPIAAAVAAAGPLVGNILHGTFLGHPLHAVVTDVPVGAWTVTALADIGEIAGLPVGRSGDTALVVGLGGAIVAALSGLADWSDTSDEPRTIGTAHMLCNSIALGGYLTAAILRAGEARRAGLWTALGAYAVVSAGAYLGGELSYGTQIGVRHTAEPTVPPEDFRSVADAAAIKPGKPLRVDFDGIPVLLWREHDDAPVGAVSAVCTHRGAPLDQGEFFDNCVRCPWHASVFDLADGKVLEGPATFPLPRFEARVIGDRVHLRAFTPVAA